MPHGKHVIQSIERRRTSDTSDFQQVRLLVVDDDPADRTFIVALTRRLGFEVSIAADGEAALEILASEPFDAVIIDLEMPRLTGLELIARLRGSDATRSLYALMLTGHDDMETKLRALEAGFDDFLGKAMPEPELTAKLAAARRIAARQRTMNGTIRELYGLATRDELTGVFNRRFFVAETERLLAADTPVTLVLFDLDDFKRINDTYGHPTGDRVLRGAGILLNQQTRPGDVVGRFGGDEFVLAIPDLDFTEVEPVAERLADAMSAQRWTHGTSSFSVGVSIGTASSQLLDRPGFAQLIEAADRDLYKNKWERKHPDEQPDLYVYPSESGILSRFPNLDDNPRAGSLAELAAITDSLKRQREDLQNLMERTASRSGEAAELVDRIEELRRRAEETQRRFRRP